MHLNLSLFGMIATAFALQAAPAQPVTSSDAATPPATAAVELPHPTGRHPVGTYMRAVADLDRREIFTADPTDHRRVSLQVYYPAAKGCQPQLYMPSPFAMMPPGSRPENGFNPRLKGHACSDAKPATGSEKYPLVLFSHGLGVPRFQYASLLEDLASQGNIVVAIDHPHGAPNTYFPDGSLMKRDGSRWSGNPWAVNEFYRNWAEDARRVLDRIFRNDGTVLPKNLAKRLDLDRVAYLGHSYGGLSAIYSAQVDGRIKAAVNMDGGVGPFTAADGTKGPGRMLLPVMAEVPILVLNQANFDQRSHYAEPVRVARIRGATHATFSDVPWLGEMLAGTPAKGDSLKGAEAIRLTRALSSLFLKCAFTQDCAPLDRALDAARVPTDEKPAT